MRKYVHRVGRTARAGKTGDAWSLVEDQEVRLSIISTTARVGTDNLIFAGCAIQGYYEIRSAFREDFEGESKGSYRRSFRSGISGPSLSDPFSHELG